MDNIKLEYQKSKDRADLIIFLAVMILSTLPGVINSHRTTNNSLYEHLEKGERETS